MSCCAPGAEAALEIGPAGRASSPREELLLLSRDLGGGLFQTDLSVPEIHCASCMATVERALSALPGVEYARANLSMKRTTVKWRLLGDGAPDLVRALTTAGYEAHFFTMEADQRSPEYSRLIKALAVAGFCAMNIMLLSVSVWSGAEGGTRQAFHWISAALAFPAVVYSGRIFFSSAWSVLRHGRTNMDVPISIGVLMAFGLSLYDTIHGGPHAYFDAATSLLFFLLIGRTLDHVMREKARSAVAGLANLAPRGATVLDGDGQRYVPIAGIRPGTSILIAAGDRIPVDGVVTQGASELDCSVVTGEAAPKPASAGTLVQAGLLNLTGPLTITATAEAKDSFLAEMVRMMEAAEGGRARYRRLADRASALYSPVVHSIALLSFLGWLFVARDWHAAVSIAIAVLIITCPCALGLAIPIVQVVAARRLFERGVMVKDGSALERLAEVDTVLFDKTGTLTLGRPYLVNRSNVDPDSLAIAARMASGSRHPMSAAILAAASPGPAAASSLKNLAEYPGQGLEARMGTTLYRLGRPDWALGREMPEGTADSLSVSLLVQNGRELARFVFEDIVRSGTRQTIDRLHRQGLRVGIVSGDRGSAVAVLASNLGIDDFTAEMLPADKVERIAALTAAHAKVLMVGDGLNDAPALAAAHVSMAPATAADVGRNAADFVFLKESLTSVADTYEISRNAGKLIRQNFVLAVGYNAIAVPFAVFGYVTPLMAAAAMSISSVMVVANAMRLGHREPAGLRTLKPQVAAISAAAT
ncbi:cation-translocating P-type ATPase [Mesorhizobium sp. INR15]|uniref:cation-translocating P-type ATPase n=1 Tax=Mesorhizobium sp. INR15 TaxID=2654248 RepID=UPI00189641E3|nr:cation-translocating P-type ATPase [Mesorhizobium sp. INR15]QPC92962.1 cadmium-translocating P-type ATPase [Mesorhizobium sp. INR15]